MALYFDKVRLLTYQHTPVFFDAGIRFKVQKSFTITGTLLEIANTEGVGPTWTKAEILNLMAEDYQPILLNGIDFGKGKIVNVNFEQGDHVKKQEYTYQIQAYSEGNLFNAVTDEYSGIDWSGDKIHCVDRLDESFSYNESDTGDKSYEHSISVKFNRDVNNLGISPIALAKTLAQDFMDAANLTLFLGEYDQLSTLKKTNTETYNIIDFSCSFVQRVDIPKERHGNYSLSRNHSLQQNEEGIVTATEKGIIKGLVAPLSASATAGYNAEVSDSLVYGRVENIYNIYAFSLLPLHTTVIQKSVTINKFSGEIEYSFTFTNDPRINELAIWDYTIQINRSLENYIEVTESGTVKGIGRPRHDKYQHALSFYNSDVKPYIETRIRAAYAGFGGTHDSHLVRIKNAYGAAEYAGEITYSETWTDNNLYVNDAHIRKQEIEVVTEYPVQIVYTARVINVKELVQPQYNSTPGRRSVNIKLKGIRATTLTDYLDYAKGIIVDNDYGDIGEDPFIADCQYTISPLKNDFTLLVEFSFHGFYKAFGDLILT